MMTLGNLLKIVENWVFSKNEGFLNVHRRSEFFGNE
jgi:hypothetical protein